MTTPDKRQGCKVEDFYGNFRNSGYYKIGVADPILVSDKYPVMW